MKRNLFAVLILTIFFFACILPNGFTQPESVPTFDFNSLSTTIALTAQAAVAQTFAATTPTSVPPTKILGTPTATLIPPTRISPPDEGTYLSEQDDGSTLFFDQIAGYNLSIPAGWTPVRVNGPEYSEALISAASASAEFQAALKNTQDQNGDVFRLFIFNMKEDYTASQFILNINIVWDQQDGSSLDETMRKIESQYPKIFSGIQILPSRIFTTGRNIPCGLIESTWLAKNSTGGELSIYQKQAVFKLRVGTLVITLSAPSEIKDSVTRDFDRVFFDLSVK
jgi:hypothetical protein